MAYQWALLLNTFFLFGLFGAILTKIGTGEVFVDIARGLTGRVQGGPGLSAALSSALLGSLNGSAVANVVTTGTFTIPLMKRVGYSPKLAGAIEAAASSAGSNHATCHGCRCFPYGRDDRYNLCGSGTGCISSGFALHSCIDGFCSFRSRSSRFTT
ncbi:TRAP transporter large permease subunit [Vibrio ostreae]|uniref:TRAP transporter large permease subunit n=1 Tax=Vibrio ostreae TaxID=2841925 RepID=A0A975U6Q9_9VIBR|nr:TRAP transporter large permease subunit [Vibrio ostreae]